MHPATVAQQCSARHFTRWIDRNNGDPATSLHLRLNQPRNQRAFAHAGRAGQADDMGRCGQRREGIQECERLGLTVWTPVFEQVERARNSLTIKINQSVNGAVE